MITAGHRPTNGEPTAEGRLVGPAALADLSESDADAAALADLLADLPAAASEDDGEVDEGEGEELMRWLQGVRMENRERGLRKGDKRDESEHDEHRENDRPLQPSLARFFPAAFHLGGVLLLELDAVAFAKRELRLALRTFDELIQHVPRHFQFMPLRTRNVQQGDCGGILGGKR